MFGLTDKLVCWARGRSTQWMTVRNRHLDANPRCSACGTIDNTEVHHIIPVSLDKSKELLASNLITLCEKPGHNCHFVFGHLLSWKSHNKDVESDAAKYLDKVRNRP